MKTPPLCLPRFFLLLLTLLLDGSTSFHSHLLRISASRHDGGAPQKGTLGVGPLLGGKAVKDRSSSSGDDVDHRGDDLISSDSEHWRFERARLEHQNSQRILKRRPVFLPYVDACLWARSMGFASKAEWLKYVEFHKVGPYYTRDPEGYYGKQGTWRGWEHFLGIDQQRGGAPFTVTETSEHTDVD